MTDNKGIPFFPKIPTEEIFSAPHKFKVNGKLVATKPLVYGGRVIHVVSLIFQNGRITAYDATTDWPGSVTTSHRNRRRFLLSRRNGLGL
ncbi:aminopeptidase [Terribacillus sp. 7520-G]|uniref:aminopeptidase n=1 Tax=Terribacillus sp. 7520-G TaxID=2025389 RepID=UPI001E2F77E9|nr:aminopeptidase [Terribacillus sp. 7520-G]